MDNHILFNIKEEYANKYLSHCWSWRNHCHWMSWIQTMSLKMKMILRTMKNQMIQHFAFWSLSFLVHFSNVHAVHPCFEKSNGLLSIKEYSVKNV